MRKQPWSGLRVASRNGVAAGVRLEQSRPVSEPEELVRSVALLAMAGSMGLSAAAALARALFS